MINSVKHAVNILGCFSKEETEWGVSNLAKQLNMNVSTVHHIVSTLHKDGVLVKTTKQTYRLGPQILQWGQIASNQYKHYFMTIPYLEAMAQSFNKPVHLLIIENNEAHCIAKVTASNPAQIETNTNIRLPLHCTSAGKALLAFQSKNITKRVIDNGLVEYTDNTITDTETLFKELRKIRRQGYAMDNEEFKSGYSSIAAPIKNLMQNVICVISVEIPQEHIKENRALLIENILKRAKTISKNCDL